MSAHSGSSAPIVYFDGVCGLCNGFVDRLMRWDKKHVLRFATLQGTTAAAHLPRIHTEALSTIIFVDGDHTYTRSEAALRVLMRIGGVWKAVAFLLVVPRGLRDAVYNWVARNRYPWFGKHATCRIPNADERALFLP